MSQENNFNEEDYLRKHLEDLENSKSKNTNTEQSFENLRQENVRTSDLHYLSFDVKEFPAGIFYPAGTTIQVRAAQTAEIQAYSMVDDNNFYDIVEKMNDMLASCVRIKYADGKISSYLDIRDPDRYYLIFLIRELTFQKGNVLATKKTCSCNHEIQIELKRENFIKYEIDEKIKNYFNPALNCFTFELTNDEVFNLAPPKIGLQKSFTDYIIKENAEKKKPNLSFLKIIPFTLFDRNSITIEGIKSKLSDFTNPNKMSDVSFQFLNSAAEKITFGIKELKKECDNCGLEVRSDMVFPNGPSAIFVIHDAFEKFIKK
jgi:hypothetical protein